MGKEKVLWNKRINAFCFGTPIRQLENVKIFLPIWRCDDVSPFPQTVPEWQISASPWHESETSSSAHNHWLHGLPQHCFPGTLALFMTRDAPRCYVLPLGSGNGAEGCTILAGNIWWDPLLFPLPKRMLKGTNSSLHIQPLGPRATAHTLPSAKLRPENNQVGDFPTEKCMLSFLFGFYGKDSRRYGAGQRLAKVGLAGAAPVLASLYPRSCFRRLYTVLLTKYEDN